MLFVLVLLSFENILYILSTNPLSNMIFANIFIQFVDGLFILLTMPFVDKNLSIFYFD